MSRVAVVLISSVMAFVMTLVAPLQAVYAASPWSREVSFEPQELDGTEHVRFSGGDGVNAYRESGCDGTYDPWWSGDDTQTGTNPVNNISNAGSTPLGGSLPGTGIAPPFDGCWNGGGSYLWAFGNTAENYWPNSTGSPDGDTLTPVGGGTVEVSGHFISGAASVSQDVTLCFYDVYPDPSPDCAILFTVPGYGTWPNPVGVTVQHEADIPASARLYALHFPGDVIVRSVLVKQIDEDGGTEGGNCTGVGGLAWGAAGLTTGSNLTQWGHQYIAESEGCLFERRGIVHYKPPEGWLKAETHLVAMTLAAGRATIQWSCGFDADGYILEVSGAEGAVTLSNVPRLQSLSFDGCFRITFDEGAILVHLRIANVDGTEEDDATPAYGNWTKNPDGSGGIPWGECTVPGAAEHELFGFEFETPDVAAWVAFVGCLIMGLPGAVADAFTTLLEDLFVPTELGDRWEEFMDVATGKVPIVWIAEVADFLGSMVTSGNLAGPAVVASISILGATVPLDLGSWSGSFEPFRPVLAAVAYLGLGVVLFRSVGGALGMRSGGSEAAA